MLKKKISLFLMAVLLSSSFVVAEEIQHSTIRKLVSPEFNLTEVNENTVTGTFKDMSVYLSKNDKKAEPGYNGWVVKAGKKLPFSIYYKDKKMYGDFNGTVFNYESMDIKSKSYAFKTAQGETKVSYLYETKKGRHQINPLFIVKNNMRNYLVRLEGECCIGHGLYYSALLYGLTNFDEVEKVAEPEVQTETKKGEEHKH
ncbi:MAG: hypothetical protein KKD35_03650 [Elusimicrobia bacterium]|nr:hypothetical protein [Elusimicrobiota bacterium]